MVYQFIIYAEHSMPWGINLYNIKMGSSKIKVIKTLAKISLIKDFILLCWPTE